MWHRREVVFFTVKHFFLWLITKLGAGSCDCSHWWELGVFFFVFFYSHALDSRCGITWSYEQNSCWSIHSQWSHSAQGGEICTVSLSITWWGWLLCAFGVQKLTTSESDHRWAHLRTSRTKKAAVFNVFVNTYHIIKLTIASVECSEIPLQALVHLV